MPAEKPGHITPKEAMEAKRRHTDRLRAKYPAKADLGSALADYKRASAHNVLPKHELEPWKRALVDAGKRVTDLKNRIGKTPEEQANALVDLASRLDSGDAGALREAHELAYDAAGHFESPELVEKFKQVVEDAKSDYVDGIITKHLGDPTIESVAAARLEFSEIEHLLGAPLKHRFQEVLGEARMGILEKKSEEAAKFSIKQSRESAAKSVDGLHSQPWRMDELMLRMKVRDLVKNVPSAGKHLEDLAFASDKIQHDEDRLHEHARNLILTVNLKNVVPYTRERKVPPKEEYDAALAVVDLVESTYRNRGISLGDLEVFIKGIKDLKGKVETHS